MEIDFVKLMIGKSDVSLQQYIDQRRKYNPAAVFAAINELKKRGRIFTDAEIETIKSDLEDEKKKSIKRIAEAEEEGDLTVFETTIKTQSKKQVDGEKYSPNHIPANERVTSLIFSIGLLVYGTVGVWIDDLYVPGKRSRGMHFHGIPCWVMYFAFLFAAMTLLSVVVDHYDRRNNETNYRKFAKLTKIIGWTLFFSAIILDIFINHRATGH